MHASVYVPYVSAPGQQQATLGQQHAACDIQNHTWEVFLIVSSNCKSTQARARTQTHTPTHPAQYSGTSTTASSFAVCPIIGTQKQRLLHKKGQTDATSPAWIFQVFHFRTPEHKSNATLNYTGISWPKSLLKTQSSPPVGGFIVTVFISICERG